MMRRPIPKSAVACMLGSLGLFVLFVVLGFVSEKQKVFETLVSIGGVIVLCGIVATVVITERNRDRGARSLEVREMFPRSKK